MGDGIPRMAVVIGPGWLVGGWMVDVLDSREFTYGYVLDCRDYD